jgi:hypothetical protein
LRQTLIKCNMGKMVRGNKIGQIIIWKNREHRQYFVISVTPHGHHHAHPDFLPCHYFPLEAKNILLLSALKLQLLHCLFFKFVFFVL